MKKLSRLSHVTLGRAGNTDRIFLVASLGGHLTQLEAAVAGVVGARTWVTSEGVRAVRLRAAGQTVLVLPRLDIRSLRLSSIGRGVALAITQRPSTIITTGAGFAVPFSLAGKLLGAKLIFIETQARVRHRSMTGRLLGRVADHVIVQWPELTDLYPGAILATSLIMEHLGTTHPPTLPKSGTFVTVGSHDQPFDRMLNAVVAASDAGLLPSPLVIQQGVSVLRLPGEIYSFLDPDDFRSRVASAEVVITHGGSGAIATCLEYGLRPIVFVRNASEHVDAHQSDLTKKLHESDLIITADTEITESMIMSAKVPIIPLNPSRAKNAPTLSTILSELLNHELPDGRC